MPTPLLAPTIPVPTCAGLEPRDLSVVFVLSSEAGS